jgi:hypothetical protein
MQAIITALALVFFSTLLGDLLPFGLGATVDVSVAAVRDLVRVLVLLLLATVVVDSLVAPSSG